MATDDGERGHGGAGVLVWVYVVVVGGLILTDVCVRGRCGQDEAGVLLMMCLFPLSAAQRVMVGQVGRGAPHQEAPCLRIHLLPCGPRRTWSGDQTPCPYSSKAGSVWPGP